MRKLFFYFTFGTFILILAAALAGFTQRNADRIGYRSVKHSRVEVLRLRVEQLTQSVAKQQDTLAKKIELKRRSRGLFSHH